MPIQNYSGYLQKEAKPKHFIWKITIRQEKVELDEIKEVCDEQTSSMIDETVSDMLKFVQRYDSKEDYEFCKKHEATCFSVFTMGGVAYQNDNRFWVNPEEPVDPDYKDYIIDMLSSMISQDIWNTFIGHEELAFRVFLYGTHYIREEELGRS